MITAFPAVVPPPTRAVAAEVTAVLATLAWGALAIGAVYPWAYWPLALLALAAGLGGFLVSRPYRIPFLSRAFTAALTAVLAAILLQVLPLPLALHAALSPSAGSLLQHYDFAYSAGVSSHRALSIVPEATWRALALFVSFVVLMAGVTRLLALGAGRTIVQWTAGLGVLLALVAIVQKPLYAGRIYGLWAPEAPGVVPFGPFVNKNHFAGWMLMALPLVLALLCAGLERSMRGLKPGWRDRVLWLASRDANTLVLLAAGAVVMALSLVLTMSRSGILAFAVSLVLTGWFVVRGIRGRSRRTAAAAYLVLLAVTVVSWIGADTIVRRFSEGDWSEFNNRRGVWADTVQIVAGFPLTGTGINTFDSISDAFQRHDMTHRFAEAHNDYLQLAAEGGLLVSIPVIACLVFFGRDVWRRMDDEPGSTSWWLRRGAVTALVAIALQELVDFSLQIPGNTALFAVVCAVALHHAPQPRRRDHGASRVG